MLEIVKPKGIVLMKGGKKTVLLLRKKKRKVNNLEQKKKDGVVLPRVENRNLKECNRVRTEEEKEQDSVKSDQR